MIRFRIALLMSKFALFLYKIFGKEKDDKPGLLANKICPNFLSKIKKPDLVICVSGTNGKTSIVNFIADILKKEGKTISYNDWGANVKAGHARCLLDTVNIFNKSIKEAAILEVDEKTSNETIPAIKPNYFLILNLFRDSIRRNGHIDFIYNRLNEALSKVKDTTVILNANDPISSQLGQGNKRIFVSMNDIGVNPLPNNSKEYLMCSTCGEEPHYNYRLYRSIGDFYCPKCGYKTHTGDYTADKVDFINKKMDVIENKKSYEYDLVNDSVFYAFNILFVVAFFRQLGFEHQIIQNYIKNIKITNFREMDFEVNNKKIHLFACKGQNGSSSGTVFEYLINNKSNKQIIILMDERNDSNHPLETLTWIYEADFEFLKSENIKKIVVGGKMHYNYDVRLLIAGISRDKFKCVEKEEDTINYIDLDNNDEIYILFDVEIRDIALRVKNQLIGKINGEVI